MDAERRRYLGTMVDAKFTLPASRERILGTETATSPTAVVTRRSGKCPLRTTWAPLSRSSASTHSTSTSRALWIRVRA